MSIASVNATVLGITEELAILEVERTMLDAAREMLSMQSSTVYTELQEEMQRSLQTTDTETNSTDSVASYNSQQFQVELKAIIAGLENQDKVLEIERANLDTKVEELTAGKDTAEKRLEKNVERDMKGFQ